MPKEIVYAIGETARDLRMSIAKEIGAIKSREQCDVTTEYQQSYSHNGNIVQPIIVKWSGVIRQ